MPTASSASSHAGVAEIQTRGYSAGDGSKDEEEPGGDNGGGEDDGTG